MPIDRPPRRYDYSISVEPYGRIFFDRWFWKVDHIGGMAMLGASGFASSEARAIKKADRCAQRIIEQQKKQEQRRTINVR